MKLTKAQIKAFNHPNTLVVIAAYPLKTTTHTGGGIASYTKNTLLGVKKVQPSQPILVIADTPEGQETYLESGIQVVRVWKRNSPSLYLQIQSVLSQIPKAKNLLVEFEFAAFGDLATTSLLPLYLSTLKLQKYHLTLVVHQVVKSLSDLSTHIGVHNRLPIYNALLKAFYTSLAKICQKIVTLEQPLADTFNQITGTHLAIALPHGFTPQTPLLKSKAKKLLNLPTEPLYVLAFGYLSHYKGSDLLVKAFKKPFKVHGRPVKLILAGGENPTQGQKAHYQHYYKQLYRSIDSNPHIIHTGFVPGTRIKAYFSAADLCVFPYRTFMAASGPISFAFAFNKPILTSKVLGIYSKNTTSLSPSQIRNSIKKSLFSSTKPSSKQDRHFVFQGQKYLDLALSQTQG